MSPEVMIYEKYLTEHVFRPGPFSKDAISICSPGIIFSQWIIASIDSLLN